LALWPGKGLPGAKPPRFRIYACHLSAQSDDPLSGYPRDTSAAKCKSGAIHQNVITMKYLTPTIAYYSFDRRAVMLATQKRTLNYDPVQLVGTVQLVNGALFTVNCDGVDWVCQQALSCLIEPQVGDQVIISGPDHDRVYLIAVVSRSSEAPVALRVHGDLAIQSINGSVSMHSATQTHLGSADTLVISARHYEQNNESASITVGQMSYAGQEVEVAAGKTTFFSTVIGVMADRINSIARLCFRHVREVDHVRAQTIDYEAEKLTRVHGGYTTLTAQDVMKINGDQIHMS